MTVPMKGSDSGEEVGKVRILDIRPYWSEGFDNYASLHVLASQEPQGFMFEQRGPIYAAQSGIFVRFYYYTSPGDGFGGHAFKITMKDGTSKELKGPWSSSAKSVNKVFPEFLCVDIAYTWEMATWERGFTLCGGSIRIDAIVRWYVDNRHKVDWGIVLMSDGTVQPSKHRFIKPGLGGARLVAWIYPTEHEAGGDYAYNWFMRKVMELWANKTGEPGAMSGEQEEAIGV